MNQILQKNQVHESEQALAETRQIDTRTITGILGKGGAAIVYEAWIPQLELTRAVKVMRPDQTERIKDRFETEMRISARLHHPNIVEIHTVGEWDGLPFIEMEKIDGVDLEKILKEHHVLPECVVTAVAIMVCRALAYAHSQEYVLYGEQQKGIIHRDLKPSNIMLPYSGIVKLMDFGIAIPYADSVSEKSDIVDGTLQHIAPEQLWGEQIDPRADIFSLGTIMYEMVCGVKTFRAGSVKELVPLRIQNRYEPLHTLAPNANSRLVEIIEKSMAYDRAARWPDADSLLAELESLHSRLTVYTPDEVIREIMAPANDFDETVLKLKRRTSFARRAVVPAIFALVTLIAVGLFLRTDFETGVSDQQGATAPESVADRTPGSLATVEARAMPDRSAKAAPKTHRERPSKRAPAVVSGKAPAISGKKDAAPPKATSVEPMPTVRVADELVASGETVNESSVGEKSISPEEFLVLLRELEGQQSWVELGFEISRKELVDGEYLLRKGRYLKANGEISEAIAVLDKAMSIPSQLMSSHELAGHCLFSKAQCLSVLFDRSPSSQSADIAMEIWFMVKYQFRTAPSNTYFVSADREIRRISERLQASGDQATR